MFTDKMEKHASELQNCKEGSVGYDMRLMLKKHELKVIPKFENHDLKHLLLGYGMTSIEEIKMQMFLLGNGNYTIYCLLFVASGILFPKDWRNFYFEYRKGKKASSILDLSIYDCMNMKTEELKAIYS
ncbi:hypothetical protein [Flagellimonas onchidii]|uniref:hypothetical protein n=1 Tax=Flagellimonas onchidii TaxID=2562684 RepID=UPI0010A62E3E|nr:hypothetical protein [Allomuricauda onchidii]